MGLTYDGITYRSLEEQVRYDAEQVQLLKQADATINESLQTINTEVNGKLTKPTNPSAESAVTMLADGTVGTKPLSEIGGGELYKHYITINSSTDGINLIFFVNSTRSTSYTLQEIQNLFYELPVSYSASNGEGAVRCIFFDGLTMISGVIAGTDSQPVTIFSKTITVANFSDNVTQL